VLLHKDADEAGFEPIGPLRLEARPAEAAQPLHFVLFDGERDLAGAGITADEANLAAGQVVEHRRKVARGGAGLTRADQEFMGEQFLEGFHRRIGAGDAHVVVDGCRAEMDELGGVMAQPLRVAEQCVEQRVENGAVLQRADDRAVARRDVEEMRGRRVAAGARHVGHHHGGIAGDIFGHMPGDEPRVDVVAAASRGADEHRDLPAFIELRDRVLRARLAGGQRHDDHEAREVREAAPHAANPVKRPAPQSVGAAVNHTWYPGQVHPAAHLGVAAAVSAYPPLNDRPFGI